MCKVIVIMFFDFPQLGDQTVLHKSPDHDQILSAVSAHTGVSVERMLGTCRSRDITYARHLAMYLMREMSGRLYTEIGRIFSRNHSTVMSSCRRIEREIGMIPETRLAVESLRSKLAPPDA